MKDSENRWLSLFDHLRGLGPEGLRRGSEDFEVLRREGEQMFTPMKDSESNL